MKGPLNRDQIAQRVAQDIKSGCYANLGIGLPTKVSAYLPPEREVVLHTENGMLGMGPLAHPDASDYELIDAGKNPVTELPGASYFSQAESFGMMRGGHLDVCVLGAFQVSVGGDLANWHTGHRDAIPAVGGAMDLAIGAKQVFVVMELFTRDGQCKLVPECTYPITGINCVDVLYTDFAVFDFDVNGVTVRETFDSMTIDQLEELTNLELRGR